MAKKKKQIKNKQEEINPTSMDKRSEMLKKTKDNLSDLDNIQSVVIPDDAVVNVPIQGSFRRAIEDTLNYILSPMSASEILAIMGKLKVNFKGVDPETITISDKAVWTLMSLLMEMNYQAADQNKTVATEQSVKQSLDDMFNSMTEDTVNEVINDVRDFSKKEFGKDISKKENTNEDSSH